MKLRNMGMTGVQVSELCLGAMNFGQPDFGTDEKESRRIIDRYLDAGGNFIDTADAYGAGVSEEIVGRAIKDRRDSVVIASKGFFPVVPSFGQPPAHPNAHGATRLHLTHAVEDSLRRMGTDYIDLYQVHLWDDVTPIEETLSTLDALVKQGKIRYTGLSNYTAWQIAESRMLCKLNGWEPFATAQMQYSLVCRQIEHNVIPVCKRYGMGLLPWSPLAMGVLTGKYERGSMKAEGARFSNEPQDEGDKAWRSQFFSDKAFDIVDVLKPMSKELNTSPATVAVAWVLANPVVSSVIIGPKTVEQLEANLAAGELELGQADMNALNEVSYRAPDYPESMIYSLPRNKPAQ